MRWRRIFTMVAKLDYDKLASELLAEYKESILKIDEHEDFEEKRQHVFDFLLKAEFNRDQIQIVHQCLHSVEFDSVVLIRAQVKCMLLNVKQWPSSNQVFWVGFSPSQSWCFQQLGCQC